MELKRSCAWRLRSVCARVSSRQFNWLLYLLILDSEMFRAARSRSAPLHVARPIKLCLLGCCVLHVGSGGPCGVVSAPLRKSSGVFRDVTAWIMWSFSRCFVLDVAPGAGVGIGMGWVGKFLQLKMKSKLQLFKFFQLNWQIPNFHFMFFEDMDPIFTILKIWYDGSQGFLARVFSKVLDFWDYEISPNHRFKMIL